MDKEEDLLDADLVGVGVGVGAGWNDADSAGNVGVGGGKGKKKASSKKSKPDPPPTTSTHKFTPDDDEWAKDLPPGFKSNHKDWFDALSDAVNQGTLQVCWAVALAKCIQALYAIRGVRVTLSPQHLINNIKGKSDSTGHIIKYEELSNFLINHGLVQEDVCPFSGKIKETCPKGCTRQTAEDSFHKITEFHRILEADVKEQDVIVLLNDGPVVAVVDAYQSFYAHKSAGVYEGPLKRKDRHIGLHAVLVYGYGTTREGVHYWLVQNSWSEDWGQNGLGKIIRKCSREDGEPSLFVEVIYMKI